MEDKQKLRLLRSAVSCASDFDEAQAYAAFIFGFKEPFATRTPSDDGEEGCKHEYIEDGVYFVEDGCKPVRFADAVCVQSPKYCNVMVSYHGHKWIVCKHDLPCGETQLLKDDAKYDDKDSAFFMSEIDALNQFDMNACTAHLYERGLAFELKSDELIPTLGQLAAMYFFKNDLNDALKAVGGEPLKYEVYWSSSEIYAGRSWYVGFNDGYVNNSYKFYDYYVRPCTAFEL